MTAQPPKTSLYLGSAAFKADLNAQARANGWRSGRTMSVLATMNELGKATFHSGDCRQGTKLYQSKLAARFHDVPEASKSQIRQMRRRIADCKTLGYITTTQERRGAAALHKLTERAIELLSDGTRPRLPRPPRTGLPPLTGSKSEDNKALGLGQQGPTIGKEQREETLPTEEGAGAPGRNEDQTPEPHEPKETERPEPKAAESEAESWWPQDLDGLGSIIEQPELPLEPVPSTGEQDPGSAGDVDPDRSIPPPGEAQEPLEPRSDADAAENRPSQPAASQEAGEPLGAPAVVTGPTAAELEAQRRDLEAAGADSLRPGPIPSRSWASALRMLDAEVHAAGVKPSESEARRALAASFERELQGFRRGHWISRLHARERIDHPGPIVVAAVGALVAAAAKADGPDSPPAPEPLRQDINQLRARLAQHAKTLGLQAITKKRPNGYKNQRWGRTLSAMGRRILDCPDGLEAGLAIECARMDRTTTSPKFPWDSGDYGGWLDTHLGSKADQAPAEPTSISVPATATPAEAIYLRHVKPRGVHDEAEGEIVPVLEDALRFIRKRVEAIDLDGISGRVMVDFAPFVIAATDATWAKAETEAGRLKQAASARLRYAMQRKPDSSEPDSFKRELNAAAQLARMEFKKRRQAAIEDGSLCVNGECAA